jgi:hypothetical protein
MPKLLRGAHVMQATPHRHRPCRSPCRLRPASPRCRRRRRTRHPRRRCCHLSPPRSPTPPGGRSASSARSAPCRRGTSYSLPLHASWVVVAVVARGVPASRHPDPRHVGLELVLADRAMLLAVLHKDDVLRLCRLLLRLCRLLLRLCRLLLLIGKGIPIALRRRCTVPLHHVEVEVVFFRKLFARLPNMPRHAIEDGVHTTDFEAATPKHVPSSVVNLEDGARACAPCQVTRRRGHHVHQVAACRCASCAGGPPARSVRVAATGWC